MRSDQSQKTFLSYYTHENLSGAHTNTHRNPSLSHPFSIDLVLFGSSKTGCQATSMKREDSSFWTFWSPQSTEGDVVRPAGLPSWIEGETKRPKSNRPITWKGMPGPHLELANTRATSQDRQIISFLFR